MRIKCKYKGKVSLYNKNDEIILSENLKDNDEFEPKEYIEDYLKNHKIKNLENYKLEFEFEPLIDKEWEFIDYKLGEYYLMPYFNGNKTKNNIDIYKDFYIVEDNENNIIINTYRMRYIYKLSSYEFIIIFYSLDYRTNRYLKNLALSAPSNAPYSDMELDNKIELFCKLVSNNAFL